MIDVIQTLYKFVQFHQISTIKMQLTALNNLIIKGLIISQT